ncbi:phosphoribosylglycinamide formyltransferase [Candidatus Woesearchaeota archaeon]|nr:phosphoribosylglycinamide formyltransferase [Candidatus Woesearchaeota archaeon]
MVVGIRIAVLGSTKGTDLQAVIDAIESGKLEGVEISFVLSNREDAYILGRARKHNIKAIFLPGKGREREEYDKELDKLLVEHGVELVLLIGYMKLMSRWFVQKWLNRVMNIHPSLLPKYAGGMDTNVHEEVLRNGDKVSGCSLIFIDEGADTGPVILQKEVKVEKNDTVQTLKQKVQEAEQETIIKGIELYRDGKLTVEGKKVNILE